MTSTVGPIGRMASGRRETAAPDGLRARLARGLRRNGPGYLFLLPWVGREIGTDLDIVSIIIYWPSNMIVRGISWVTGVA